LEAIKYITGTGELLTGKMLVFDGLTMSFHKAEISKRRSDCGICSENPTIRRLADYKIPVCDITDR